MSLHPTRRTATLVGALATGLVLLGGCTGDAPDSAPVPTDPATPLASYDTSQMAIVRAWRLGSGTSSISSAAAATPS